MKSELRRQAQLRRYDESAAMFPQAKAYAQSVGVNLHSPDGVRFQMTAELGALHVWLCPATMRYAWAEGVADVVREVFEELATIPDWTLFDAVALAGMAAQKIKAAAVGVPAGQ